MSNKTAVIIMAAGAGTRFKSKRSKLLHSMAGKPAIRYLSDTISKLCPEQTIYVLSHQKEEIIKTIGDGKGVSFVEQRVLDGTAGAVRVAMSELKPEIDKVVVLPGDTPCIPEMLVKQMMEINSPVTLVGTEISDPTGFGRIKVSGSKVMGIVEETDLSEDDKNINLVNTSIYSFDRRFLEEAICDVSKNKNKGEYYLTDIISMAARSGLEIECITHNDHSYVLGANNRLQFFEMGAKIWRERAENHMLNGVSILNPDRVYLDEEVKIAPDTEIYPEVFINGESIIEEDVVILEGCRINNSKISKGSIVGPYVFLNSCEIGESNKIGPFTYMRPGSKTNKNVKIGGFVETKNITVDDGSKIPHLTYLGDTSVGKNVNIGCGVITCNYDGVSKYRTEIGDDAFIGSDSQLIAPVKINKGAYIAAGTTVTMEVGEGALAIARVEQRNIEGYRAKFEAKKKRAKK